MADPFTIGAAASMGANLLSNLFAPGKTQFDARDIREMIQAARVAGSRNIQFGVGEANRAAAAQAAQSGINDPNFLARMTGLNEQTGARQMASLNADLAQTQVGSEMGLAQTNAQLGQAKAQGIGGAFAGIGDVLGTRATLEWLTSNPELLNTLRGGM